MDRNKGTFVNCNSNFSVALRKESVDRNANPGSTTLTFPVALRKESVDRNKIGIATIDSISRSLSARRAWIEIRAKPLHKYHRAGRSPQGERG